VGRGCLGRKDCGRFLKLRKSKRQRNGEKYTVRDIIIVTVSQK
jgi:hypothetical protein